MIRHAGHFLEYPEDEEAMNAEEQFFFGRELLVAPVVEEGAHTKRVYLPKREWILFDNFNTRFNGGRWIDLPVILETIPLFEKAGSKIPMMPVMQHIHERDNYTIILRVFPKQNSVAAFTLYEDDGTTNNYKRGIASTTSFEYATIAGAITFKISSRKSEGFKPEIRNYLIDSCADEAEIRDLKRE